MQPKIEAFRKAVLADPAVESVGGFIGGGRGINNAWTFIRLKPLAQRKVPAQQVVERLQRNLPKVPGARMWHVRRPGHPLRRGGWAAAAATSTRCSPTTRACCARGASRCGRRSPRCPSSPASTTSSSSSQQVELTVDRAEARRLGVEMTTVTQTLNNAFGQRQVSTIYNALNQYRVVMEVAPEHGAGAGGARSALRDRRARASGCRSRRSAATSTRRADDRVSHSGQFASTTISFELKPGRQREPGAGLDRARGGAARDAGGGAGHACRATRGSSDRCRATSRSRSSARCSSSTSCSACSTRATCTR